MTTEPKYFEHLVNIHEAIYQTRMLPFHQRVEPVQQQVQYFSDNLSEDLSKGIKEVVDMQLFLKEELDEAKFYENAYDLLLVAFLKARDQLTRAPKAFKGLGEVIEQVPCKASEETIVHLLRHSEFSVEHLVATHLAENNALRHPERISHSDHWLEG